jgi:class 3 adenylate cyclase
MTSSIATILFTDVVDSAALMQRLGDERTGGRLERVGSVVS